MSDREAALAFAAKRLGLSPHSTDDDVFTALDRVFRSGDFREDFGFICLVNTLSGTDQMLAAAWDDAERDARVRAKLPPGLDGLLD